MQVMRFMWPVEKGEKPLSVLVVRMSLFVGKNRFYRYYRIPPTALFHRKNRLRLVAGIDEVSGMARVKKGKRQGGLLVDG
jgi:hypothetical protein